MKKLNLVSLMVICFFLVSVAANASGLRTEFRKYEISPVEDLFMGKKIEKIWTISYSTNETPVTVIKRNTAVGTEYLVYSKYFEVCYANSPEGFGVREVENSWRNVPKRVTKAVLNAEDFKRQRLISSENADDKKALGLIACYLPELINDGYTHLLN